MARKKAATKTPNERIRKVYEDTGITYAQLAEELGVSYYTVESWFKPDTSPSYRAASVTTAKLVEMLQPKLTEIGAENWEEGE